MNGRLAIVSFVLVTWLCAGLAAGGMDLPFTYQGQLKQDGQPVNGPMNFRFSLWDMDMGGTQIGDYFETWKPINVVDGLFTAEIEPKWFGETAFNGEWRWLQVDVADGGWVTLSPRQLLTATPFALYALDGAGGGGGYWQPYNNHIWYGDGNVGIGQQPSGNMALKVMPGEDDYGIYVNAGYSSAGTAIIGISEAQEGTGLFGRAEDEYGVNYGVHGISLSPEGYGGYFEGRGYFSGNVGLGERNPTEKLDVAGTVKATGLQMTTGAQDGYVLTSDVHGVGTWQPGGGGGSSPWSQKDQVVYYNDGNVGIGTSTPTSRLYVQEPSTYAITGRCIGENTEGSLGGEGAGVEGSGSWIGVLGSSNGTGGTGVKGEAGAATGATTGVSGRSYATAGQSVGVHGEVASPDGHGVHGRNTATTGNAVGVYGESATASGFGGYFVGKGYFSGNVGIGTASPTAKLGVVGVIESLNGGFKFPDGTTQTTAAAGGGGSLWTEGYGGDIYYSDGNVGIGISNPSYPLEIETASSRCGYFKNTATSGQVYSVYGATDSTSGYGLYGTSSATSGTTAGVYGRSYSPNGSGVYGINTAGGKAIYGYAGTSGWAGYFSGDTFVSGDLGIGTGSPTAKLDVAGTVRMNGFKLDSPATSGYVLTCDSSGNGSWQEPTGSGGGLTLPYSGSVSSSSPAFEVTNSGTGIVSHAISARINNASSHGDACAGYFSASGSNGYAIYAIADGTAVSARCANTSGNAFYGTSSGTGGGRFTCNATDGYGVKGEASATSGISTIGGWFESSSSSGKGVYAYVDGDYATAVKAIAEGGEGVGLHAESPWTGIVAKGSNAAKFFGDICVYEYGTYNQVFRVNDSTGVTSVDVLQITGGSDLAEPFDVSEQAEPGTVVEIDPDNPGKLRIARGAYNRRVAGVISGANGVGVGMMLADLPGSENSMPIALSGRVWVKCDASVKAVEPGDLLTTAELAGHAMPVLDHSQAHGAVIGKAMSTLAQGETGMVLVLVNLQ